MARASIFEWEGHEYEHNPKSADWYWALGIIAVAAATAAILFSNYLLGLVVLAAAVAIALHGTKHPPLHQFRVVEHALVIGEEVYPFEEMISFSVLEDIEGELPPLLSIKNESWLSPHLMIPLEGVDADSVYAYFLQHVDEDKHHHTFADVVAAWLGF
jgi:hypothetical protein